MNRNRIVVKNGLPTPKPFVKWAGGKRQLIDTLLGNAPRKYNTFFEPFIGGGAVLFALQPSKAIVSDINSELINAYAVIKNNVSTLIKNLKKYKNDEDAFYKERGLNPKDIAELERACRFLYLNKTCYNGLYRENSKGQFNTPFGHYKNPKIVDEENLLTVAEYLNSADIQILNQDYKQTVSSARKGDFIYFDPPYHPISQTASFTKYAKGDFLVKDQEELAETFHQLAKKGCQVMLSNSNASFIKELYKDFNIVEIEATRFINCKGDKRGKGLYEVIIKNY